MSTINTSIIKALVEHIGGDSSGIPDGVIGGGGAGQDILIPATWNIPASNRIRLTFSAEHPPKGGTIFKLVSQDIMYTFACVWFQTTGICFSTDDGLIRLIGKKPSIENIDGHNHYTYEFNVTNVQMPDNVNTGLFTPGTLSSCLTAVQATINTLPNIENIKNAISST